MTAIATQTINLDLRPHFNRQNNCIVYCSQYDNDLRNVVVNIADAGTAVNVSTYTIYIEGTKPDKKGFSYELTDIGGTVSNNVVTFPLQLQMTACAGITNAELVFYSGDDRVGSSNFILAVEKAGLADDIDVSETDIPAYVDGAQQAAQAAEDAKDAAVDAKDTAVAVAASIPADYTTLSNDVDDLKSAINHEAEALGSIQYLAKGTATLNNINLVSNGEKITVNGSNGGNFIVLLSDTIKTITYSTIEDQTKPIHLKAGHTYIVDINATAGAYASDNAVRFALATGNVSSINNVYFWAPCRTGKYVINVYEDADVCAMLFAQYSTAVTNLEVFAYIIDTLNSEIERNSEKLENLRTLYYTATIPITKQQANTYIPFEVHSGETLKFTNNTTGNIAIYVLDANGTQTIITSGITAGSSITFTATAEYVQMLYWSQQLGSVAVEKTSSLYNALVDKVNELETDSITASVNMFGTIAAIGDSYTKGSAKTNGGTWVDCVNQSWIATMGKRSGVEWKNYGHGGTTTKTYLETTEFASALSDTAADIYFFALGQNDGNQGLTIGTVADIHDADYTQNADTFYGNYGRIIQQIKNHAPSAKLVMITNWVQGSTWTDYDTAIRGIATHYSIPVIEPFDDYFFNSELYQSYKNDGHPTAMGYSSMGIAMERLFSKCVVNNPSYFKFATIG